jgi:hypothetical protein
MIKPDTTDAQALRDAGRKVLCLDLGENVAQALLALSQGS